MLENNRKTHYPNLWWLALSILIMLLDRLAKIWAVQHLNFNQPVQVLPFFNLTLAYNTGAAFSFLSGFQGGQRWLLGGFCVLISIAIIIWLIRLPPQRKWMGFALALVLGGGLANLWDRITLGHVIDFIQLHTQHWSFAIFNVGDSAITVGAVILIIDMLWGKGAKKG